MGCGASLLSPKNGRVTPTSSSSATDRGGDPSRARHMGRMERDLSSATVASAATRYSSQAYGASMRSFLSLPRRGSVPGEDDASTATAKGYSFQTIRDKYETLEEVSDALHAAGLESSNLIVAIDYTKSNTWTGKHTFGGRSLHWLDPANQEMNPYQLAIRCIGQTLAHLDDDNLIPVFGFGDSTTADRSVFPFYPDRPARGFEELLERYKELTPKVVMGGPTNFAPAIEAAIQIVKATRSYHVLLIIADGQVTNRAHTEAAIVRASEYPLSIILVGVGDGPWEEMDSYDNELPQRAFDNFQFVPMNKIMAANPTSPEVAFALAALMEIPEQFMAIRKIGLI